MNDLFKFSNNIENNNFSLLPSSLSSIKLETMKPDDPALITVIKNDPIQSSSIAMATSSSDPSVNQTDNITDYDSNFTKFGDLDRPTIAKLCEFDIEKPTACARRQPIRLNTKSMAIISWTNVSTNIIMNHIEEQFKIKKIQYVCIGEDINEVNHQNQICIQILFKTKINKKTRFLDQITRSCCNYIVTNNILAWNDYIKKDLNYIEFGQFLSKIHGYRQYPSQAGGQKEPITRKQKPTAKITTNKKRNTKATTTKTTKSNRSKTNSYNKN